MGSWTREYGGPPIVWLSSSEPHRCNPPFSGRGLSPIKIVIMPLPPPKVRLVLVLGAPNDPATVCPLLSGWQEVAFISLLGLLAW